ncbi:MAG: hypothetical protein ABR498_07825 [Candidatus Dormibacteria bacterium]
MADTTTFDVWGFRTPPSWALRALEKGIIDVNRFEALVRLAAEDPDAAPRTITRRAGSCSCRRRPRRACTTWRI